MPKTPAAKIDFIKKSVADKVKFAIKVHDDIGNNVAKFPTPDLDLGDFETDYDYLSKQSEIADKGNHEAVAEVKKFVKIVNDDLRVLAKYVTRIAKGDVPTIIAGGFNASSTEVKKAKLPVQGIATGTPGTMIGSLAISGEKLEFAGHYIYIAGKDLSGVTFVDGTVVIQPSLIDPANPSLGVHPVIIKTHKLPTTEIGSLDSRADYQCIYLGVSSVGAGLPSEVITVTTK